MKRIRFLLVIGVVFICTPFFANPHLFSQSLYRRTRALGFDSLIQQLKSGEQKEIAVTYTDGSYVIKVEGKYLEPVAGSKDFSSPRAFLSIRVYDEENKPLGYYVIYPTARDYQGEFSARRAGGEFINLGSLAPLLMREAGDSFGVITSQSAPQFNTTTFTQLEAKTAPYLYVKNYSSADSPLASFIQTVDELKSSIDISASTVANILTASGWGNFSQYGYYYWIAKHYPGGLEKLQDSLSVIKQNGKAQNKSITDIESAMLQHIRDRVSSREEISADILWGFLFAAGVLSVSDYLAPELDEVLKSSDKFLSLQEASQKIQQDIDDGVISSAGGWLGVCDLDNLRLFNAIYSKPVINVVLSDIRKIFNYYLSKTGGFAFSFRTGDEIGIYMPAIKDAGVITANIRKAIQSLRYEVFTLSDNISPEQLEEIKTVLSEYGAYISPHLYGGHQLGIIRLENNDKPDKLSRMFNVLHNSYGLEISARTYLGSIAAGTLLPTFSAGIVSLKEGEDVPPLEQSFFKAEDTLREAKSNGKNRDIIGYDPGYSHSHTGQHIITEEFLKQLDEADSQAQGQGLTPSVDDEQHFREKVYQEVSQGQSGMLIIINPRYDGEDSFHDMNEKYTYTGGDDVIKTLAHFCSTELGDLGRGVLIGRRVDRIFVFIPGFTAETPEYEDALREKLSRIQFDFEDQIPQVEIAFDAYAAFTDEETQNEPGLLFQRVAHANVEDSAWRIDLWGTTLSIYGVETESNAANIENKIAQDALQELTARILEMRIIPAAKTLDAIQSLCRQDPVLSKLNWPYIKSVIEQRELLPAG